MRPPIIMLPLMNKMSWAMFARGKNVRCDYDPKIKLNVAIKDCPPTSLPRVLLAFVYAALLSPANERSFGWFV